MTVGVSAFLAGGCSMLSFGRSDQMESQPEPIAAAPSGTVTGGTLPPPGQTDPMAQPVTGAVTPPVDPSLQTASASPIGAATPAATAAAPGSLGRTDLLGGWTISSAGDSCQLFMTLTTWAGGYRASTRGCTNAALTTISAWNMDGGQVQLFNDTGTTIARLYPASKTLFNGQTEGGGPVTVSR